MKGFFLMWGVVSLIVGAIWIGMKTFDKWRDR